MGRRVDSVCRSRAPSNVSRRPIVVVAIAWVLPVRVPDYLPIPGRPMPGQP